MGLAATLGVTVVTDWVGYPCDGTDLYLSSLFPDIVRQCSSQELSVLKRSWITPLIPSNTAVLRNNIWDFFFHCLHSMCSCASVSCAPALKGVHYSSLIEKAVAWGKRWPSLVLSFWLVIARVAVKKGTLVRCVSALSFLYCVEVFRLAFSENAFFFLNWGLPTETAQIFW